MQTNDRWLHLPVPESGTCQCCGKLAQLAANYPLCEQCHEDLHSSCESKRARVRAALYDEPKKHWLAELKGLAATKWELLPCDDASQAAVNKWQPTVNKPFLIIHGASHIGKTRMAVLTIDRLAKEIGATPCAIWPGELGMFVAEAWKSEEGPTALLQQYTEAPLLLLDDLDKCKPTERASEFLLSVLKARARAGKTTIITTNLVSDELRKQFGVLHGPPIANELRAYSTKVAPKKK